MNYEIIPLKTIQEPDQEIADEDGLFAFVAGPTKISYHRKSNAIGITLLMTHPDHLGMGYARIAMEAFLKQCDLKDISVYLTSVATEKQVSKSRLNAFYKSLEFFRNKQREKCFWATSEPAGHFAMCRESRMPKTIDVGRKADRSCRNADIDIDIEIETEGMHS